ncbi:inositol monophosphatase [Nonomuraea phyllanthi]|uniref:Inositol-1-monophosphatase n=1 Tax=Nonomuraea phyllanthi TaxID=2219224 RepID=A0A5C4V3G6_9ACTN|nr:inositol monophosphatase family protein [Nonomuraea phyllanthi]KAB8185165.1 inositol monophosphatase [Nonomuraea phyllanthi]QFY13396.1 inositol monophosphatase [Nonomuraea phyllanthi]
MDVNDSRELAAIAAEAAGAVGDRLRGAFRSRPEVRTKRDFHDPVTEHDKAAEEEIREVLDRRSPGSVVVGEEGGTRGSGDVSWYVDPIDGTANFAAGLPFFCTSIAAAVDGEVVAGVVYDPVRDDRFIAWLGGAECNGEPLRSTGARTDREAMLLSSYPTPRDLAAEGDQALHRYARMVNAFASTRRPGSAALKLAHVAAGWSDVAYGTYVSAWDVAAGSLLVTRAGGVYIPLSGSVFTPGGYLACVGGFDLAGSVLAEVADGRPA